MHKEHLFQMILLLTIVLSGIMAICNLETAGIITLNNFGTYNNGVLPGEINIQSPINSGSASIISGDDFTNATGYNASSVYYSGSPLSTWTQTNGQGLVLSNPLGILGWQSIFEIRGIQPNSNGVYDVTYTINNAVNSPFEIAPVISNGYDYIAIQFSYNDVEVDIPPVVGAVNQSSVYTVLFSSSYYYPSVVSTVETLYNPTANTLGIIINGGTATAYSTTVNLPSGTVPSGVSPIDYAGVDATTTGFAVQKIWTPINTATAAASATGAYTGIGWLDAIIGFGAAVWNDLAMLAGVLTAVFGFQSSPFFPPWEFAIVIGSCIGTVILIIVETATNALP